MSDFVKSELLRSVSGLAMLGVFSFVILIPTMMLWTGPSLEGLREVDDVYATRIVFGLFAAIGITAMYLGSYAVSREYYYNSMSRSLVMGSMRRVFVSKLIASAITAVAMCLIGSAIWAGVSAAVLSSFGRRLQIDGAFWTIVGGSVFAALCGSVIGVSLGWVIKGYYAVSAVVLLVPVMIELPLLFNVPIVERFLPVGAFAGVTGAPVDDLLPWWGSALVLLAWSAATVVFAVTALRRREH